MYSKGFVPGIMKRKKNVEFRRKGGLERLRLFRKEFPEPSTVQTFSFH